MVYAGADNPAYPGAALSIPTPTLHTLPVKPLSCPTHCLAALVHIEVSTDACVSNGFTGPDIHQQRLIQESNQHLWLQVAQLKSAGHSFIGLYLSWIRPPFLHKTMVNFKCNNIPSQIIPPCRKVHILCSCTQFHFVHFITQCKWAWGNHSTSFNV